MFELNYEKRLGSWSELRESIETSNNPYQDVIDFYKQAPQVSIHTDPWDNKTWPDPWELLLENQYCEFCTVLGMCYSLQLTERFSEANFEIHIGIDEEKSKSHYLLSVNKQTIIGWDNKHVDIEKLPKSYQSQKIYRMPKIQ
jgi:hypothetical protein